MEIYTASGVKVASYAYDAWGNHKIYDIYGDEVTDNSHIGYINPIRYRGYYFDVETNLYYLQTRYYDPETGRFINADSIEYLAPKQIMGLNLYAYCNNNPVMGYDPSGNWWLYVGKAMDVGVKYVGNWIDQNVVAPVKKFAEDIVTDYNNFDCNNQDPKVVFESNYFSCYKGAVVIKGNFFSSFSFGFIGLDIEQQNKDTLNHEYGHIIQLLKKGFDAYLTDVAIPSVTASILDRMKKLTFDYYSSPWEAEADLYGGVERNQFIDPWTESDGYFWNLIPLFFQ